MYRTKESETYSGIKVQWTSNEELSPEEKEDDAVRPIVIVGVVLSASAFI
jgi:hypothetical protein